MVYIYNTMSQFKRSSANVYQTLSMSSGLRAHHALQPIQETQGISPSRYYQVWP